MIGERLPVSTYFGLLTFAPTYMVCIPSEFLRQWRHKQLSDDLTSILIFIGYAVPRYALGSLLLFLSVNLDLFQCSGWLDEEFTSYTISKSNDDGLYLSTIVLLSNWRICFRHNVDEKSLDG